MKKERALPNIEHASKGFRELNPDLYGAHGPKLGPIEPKVSLQKPQKRAEPERKVMLPLLDPGCSQIAYERGESYPKSDFATGWTYAPVGVSFTVPGNPMGKPRMTQRDKWAKRPAVIKYRAWSDKARECAPEGLPKEPRRVSWIAYFEIPKSWSKAKRKRMAGAPHQSKPDRDNIDKCVLDSLFPDDSSVADGLLSKRWDDGNGPRIEIYVE